VAAALPKNVKEGVMSDLLKWSPFKSVRWPSADESGITQPQRPKSVERALDPADEPARIRVDEYVDDRTLVGRAALPGVDPAKEIEGSVANGVLHIGAERQEKGRQSDKDLAHSVLRYGSFKRNVPLPKGVRDEDIKASYRDRVLEVRTPIPQAGGPASEEKRLPISRDELRASRAATTE
jgi:HSP20 family protein